MADGTNYKPARATMSPADSDWKSQLEDVAVHTICRQFSSSRSNVFLTSLSSFVMYWTKCSRNKFLFNVRS